MKNYKHKIASVMVLPNGMVAVFDQNNKQMPFFQGSKRQVMPKIKRRLERQKGIVKWWMR